MKNEIIHHEFAEIKRDKQELSVISKNTECVFKKNEMYLLRKTAESTIEGIFKVDEYSRMMLETKFGQMMFDIKTIDYSKKGDNIVLVYQLYSDSNLIDTFHYKFSIINKTEKGDDYAE